MIVNVRGYKILCYAKSGNVAHYHRMYSKLTDERLAELEQESSDEVRGQHTTQDG